MTRIDLPATDGRAAAVTVEADIDTLIARAEAAVQARDARVQAGGRALVRRGSQGLRRHAGTALGIGGGVALLAWWLNRRRPAGPAPASVSASATPPDDSLSGEAGLLAGLLPMLWPWLPKRWRELVSPATARSLLATALPLALRWWRRRSATGAAAGGDVRP